MIFFLAFVIWDTRANSEVISTPDTLPNGRLSFSLSSFLYVKSGTQLSVVLDR